MDQALLDSLKTTLEQWARERGLALSALGAGIAGGLTINATVLPEDAYATLFRQYGQSLGYPADALGAELTLEEGDVVTVLGLDPVGELPLLIVQSGDERFHLPRPAFDKAWAG